MKQYTPPAQIKNALQTTRNYICPNNQAKFLRAHKYRARATLKSKSSASQWYARLTKYYEEPVWAYGTMLHLLTTVVTKLK
jgi:hypothetical protein